MIRKMSVSLMVFAVISCIAQNDLSMAAASTPPLTPHLQLLAEFTEKTRCPVFEQNEPVSLWIAVDGRRISNETVLWNVKEFRGNIKDKGSFLIPKGTARWESILKLKNYGAGYFEVHLSIKGTGTSILQAGSRPSGFVVYGVLPAIQRLPLSHVDQSRFGAQGTNFIKSGKFLDGDYIDPVYPLLGAKWAYLNRHIGELFAKESVPYVPRLDSEKFEQSVSYESQAGLSMLVDLHGIPDWLWKVSDGSSKPKFDNTRTGQRFAPNDFGKFKDLVAKLVCEQVVRRKTLFPNQSKNYYQIHWEPDWHWKGSDEDFIMMYKIAHEAIHENDPDGLLLGPNYGVLKTGNSMLKRLFTKGLGKYLDGILTHTYFLTQGTPENGGLVEDVRELAAMTKANLSPGAKIINTEWGTWWNGRPPSVDPEALRTETANFMRGHLIALGEGVDTTFFFYTADGSSKDGGGLLYNLTCPHPSCGATHVAPKPVFMAAAAATRLLEGSKSLGALEYLHDDVLGYAFDKNGQTVVSLWSTDNKNRVVKVPVGNAGRISVLDPMGNTRELVCTDGVVSVEAGAIPIWLLGIDPVVLPSTVTALQLPVHGLPGQTLQLFHPDNEFSKTRIFDGLTWIDAGGSGVLQVPVNMKPGKRLAGLFDNVSGKIMKTSQIEIKPPIEVVFAKTTSPRTGVLVFNISNQQPEDISGVLSLMQDGKTIAEKGITLANGGQEKIIFEMPQDKAFIPSSQELRIFFHGKNGFECSFKVPPQKAMMPAYRTLTVPTVNGNLNDWRLELFQTIEDNVNPAAAQNGMALRMAAQYDDKALYLAFQVYDKIHVQGKSPADSWNGDSIQIGLAIHASGKSWRTWQKLCFALDSQSGALIGYRHNGSPGGIISQDDVSWAIARDGDYTSYEIAVPWGSMSKNLSGPPKEGVLGLGIMVNDVDIDRVTGLETPRVYKDVLGGMSWSKPEDFGILELKL